MTPARFFTTGWCRFGFDAALARWVEHVLPVAREAVRDQGNSSWLRCGGTWFAGVNALPNDARGRVGESGPLQCKAVEFIDESLVVSEFPWDRGQLSVCYPGYPRPMPGETPGAFRFRQVRDAAHVDGLLPEGPRRRRHLREHHAFILGIPMVDFSADAAPFVVWEGSHETVRAELSERLAALPPDRWGDEDLTDAYHRARRNVFEQCRRVELHVEPGECFLVHRLAVHGVAPWSASAVAGEDGRMICYFRPEIGEPWSWLRLP